MPGTIIVAMNRDRVIGKANTLPWHYRADMRRFKRLTMGWVLIMGRKTWESLPIKPLPGRLNLVVSRKTTEELSLPEGALACSSVNEALGLAEQERPGSPVWFIGGAALYQEALEHAEAIDMTLVPDEVEQGEGVVLFPELPEGEWEAGPVQVDEKEPRLKRQLWQRRR